MYKSRMRSVALMMAVALTASVSASAASASTAVERSNPSELHFIQPAAFTTSTQTHAVASAPASKQSFVCEPEDGGRSSNFMPISPSPCTPPPPPPPTGFKPDLV